MKYDINIIEEVLKRYEENKNISELSRIYSVPRHTILYWLKSNILNTIQVREEINQKTIDSIYEHISLNKKEYSFILGLYLGDGCITQNGRNDSSYKLRIAQDNKYPKSIHDIKNKLSNFFVKEAKLVDVKGCCHITIYDKYLPIYFPQHSKGFKHDRKINLNQFQLENIDHAELMSGLWLADGSRYFANHGKYKYERFNFTNKSLDIIELFESCLNKFEIKYSKRVKPDKIWIIEIQNKENVNKIKNIVGIKE
jgi:hypothetical protein